MSNTNLSTQVPDLDGKNWDRWCLKMEVIFGFWDVLDIIMDEYGELGKNPTEAQRTEYKKKKNFVKKRKTRRKIGKACTSFTQGVMRKILTELEA